MCALARSGPCFKIMRLPHSCSALPAGAMIAVIAWLGSAYPVCQTLSCVMSHLYTTACCLVVLCFLTPFATAPIPSDRKSTPPPFSRILYTRRFAISRRTPCSIRHAGQMAGNKSIKNRENLYHDSFFSMHENVCGSNIRKFVFTKFYRKNLKMYLNAYFFLRQHYFFSSAHRAISSARAAAR